MGLFSKKSPIEKLQEKYQKLMKASFNASSYDRIKGDRLYAEAQLILKEMEKLEK